MNQSPLVIFSRLVAIIYLHMMKLLNIIPLSIIILLLFLSSSSCHSLDILTPSQPLQDGDVLVSTKGTFALGFFSPTNSSRNRYLGIWYNRISVQTVVWVANRDTPLNHTYGLLSINTQGNVVVLDNNNNPIWSSNVSFSISYPNTSAKLLDTGNLVLLQNDHKVLWQSFDHPCDTSLPFMKIGFNRKTGLNWTLTSWKSPTDPGHGNSTHGIDPTNVPQMFLYKNGQPIWRVGSWTGQRWSGVPEMTPNFVFQAIFVDNADEVSITYEVKDPTARSRMVLRDTGHVRRYIWQAQKHKWAEVYHGPREECDNYRRCGSNSNCNPDNLNKFKCECLPGFEPKFTQEWYDGVGSSGCVRKKNVSTCRSGEGFVKVARVKTPDTSRARVDKRLSLKECKEKCLRDCSCAAYTSEDETTLIGCLTWHADMEDIRTYTRVGQDLFVRVDAIELAKYAKKPFGSLGIKGMVALLVVSLCLTLFLVTFSIYWFAKEKKKAKRMHKSFCDLGRGQNSDLQFFDLSDIAAATEDFSPDNKLGQGGFGSVYKGVLSNGLEIAVKRLSKNSVQGTQEFKNEVVLIAKLQHINLVRILGCCIQGEEKMLIYEYLPNKSLDSFIFDQAKKLQLDWKKRFDIICGIARGILYLHRDSRLRIIHRDLKASNVLLDSEFNPKIADFGMARIFGGDEIEANTNRVVGTYGYMSPEYAMEGLFSIKSDVYSFGVLLLEVITSRKNNNHYEDFSSTLIGHIWNLWREGRAMEIVDPSLGDERETRFEHELVKCMQIGLLCVQDQATDRPSMSEVVSMLGSTDSSAIIPSPKQPAFIFNRRSVDDHSNPSNSEAVHSVNQVSITMIEAR